MKEHFTQKDMLDHVGKLQDRERQKITSMGLSNWVLFVTIGTLGYFLFPGINLIRANLSYTILSYVLFLNLAVAIFDIFNGRFRQNKIGVYRKLSEKRTIVNSQIILRDFELILVVISFVLNFVILFWYPIYLFVIIPFIHRYFWNLFGIMYTSYEWLPKAINRLVKYFREKASITEEEAELMRVDRENSQSVKVKTKENFKKILLLILSIVPFMYRFLTDNLTDLDLKLNLYGFILVLITFMIQFLFVIFSKRMKIGWLESFEREIIQNNLPASTIRSRLTKEYYSLSNIDDYF
jgi:hypothetical protein